MGYARQDGRYVVEYVADTWEDIEDIPTTNSPGSTCLVIETGDVLVLTSEHEWVPLGYNA